jgi:hypothetical protein
MKHRLDLHKIARTHTKSPQSSQNGYVALITVLIVGAASLAVALALLVGGADSQRSALVTQQSAQARSLAKSCVEEALQQMRDNQAYVGTNTLTFPQGSCTYIVTNTGGNNRTISASGTVGNVVRKISAYATITSSSLSITSWQEVS